MPGVRRPPETDGVTEPPRLRLGQGRTHSAPIVHAFVGLPPQAICRAGIITAREPGWFDGRHPEACPSCAEMAEELARG